MRTLVWFRGKDLRLGDHRPLTAALERGPIVPLFVLDPYFFARRRAQELPHRMQYLLDALSELDTQLRRLGAPLLLRKGKSTEVVPEVAHSLRCDRVLAQEWVEPFGRRRDRIIAERLRVPLELLEGETLLRPGRLRTAAGRPYVVFSPFARAFLEHASAEQPLPQPRRIACVDWSAAFSSAAIPSLVELGITPNDHLLPGGRTPARGRLAKFLTERLASYSKDRDLLARDGTSRLSADLKFGALSPREVASSVRRVAGEGSHKFLSELMWREFSYSTLRDFPHLLSGPFREEFERIPYRAEESELHAWKQGRTGYPVVDAAARQLLREGYVHNRARMIAASFLTKHLLHAYTWGESHYMKFLVDGDWAQNNFGWQWSAGSGVGAQPYFRVFNPTTQGRVFDPRGEYVRRYVPELESVPDAFIHEPWKLSPLEQVSLGVRLGVDYPYPIVDHAAARARYLATVRPFLKRTVDNGNRGPDAPRPGHRALRRAGTSS